MNRDWSDEAACRDEPPETFFPAVVGGRNADARRQKLEARAKAICNRCPVRGECLAFARRTNQQDGIWGGMTADERRALR